MCKPLAVLQKHASADPEEVEALIDAIEEGEYEVSEPEVSEEYDLWYWTVREAGDDEEGEGGDDG